MSIGKGAWNGGKRCCGTAEGERERETGLQKLFPSLEKQCSKGFKLDEFQSKSSQDKGLRGARAITHPPRGMNK